MDVHAIMHDFGWALINSVVTWFKCEHHMGCCFRWKQALCKDMVNKGLTSKVVALILPEFDFLIVIDRADMDKGVEYIKEIVLGNKRIKRRDKIIFKDYWSFIL